MSKRPVEPFSLHNIPRGPLVVEASAGTGKTYTITNLVTKAIATGEVDMASLLVVTFTRAAAAELTTRIRARLSAVAEALEHDGTEPTGDELVDLLRAEPGLDPLLCRNRLRLALSSFDEAVITTIHGFAMQALASIGLATASDPDARVLEDTRAAVREVAHDFLATAALNGDGGVIPGLDRLTSAADKAIAMPDVVVLPNAESQGAEPDDVAFVQLVADVVAEVRRRRTARSVVGFTDLLVNFESMVAGGTSASASTSLRHRFKLVLIDEFQDTDPLQWSIFSSTFGTGPDSNLTLVGDPKQAIYSFRGADVATYLQALSTIPVENHRALLTNWRADGPVIESLNVLFDDATFGKNEIAYHPVRAADEHVNRHMCDLEGNSLAPLGVRMAIDDDLERSSRSPHNVLAPGARSAIVADLVARVIELCGRATIPSGDGSFEPVGPGDIAVLVSTQQEASLVAGALADAGVPAVLARGTSVLLTEAASQWRVLLEAAMRPADGPRARRAALGWFFDIDPTVLDQDADTVLVAVQDRLASFKMTAEQRGIVAFLREVTTSTDVVERLLRTPSGERAVTDLEHVGELFETMANEPGLGGLLSMLVQPRASDSDPDNDPTLRRVDRGTGAVTVMTVWVSKGLEFPIVLAPFLWSRNVRSSRVFVDEETHKRCLDVAAVPWPTSRAAEARKDASKAEQLGEMARLTYVALTRARHHTTVWWTSTIDTTPSPLTALLFGANARGARSFTAAQATDALAPLLDRLGALVEIAVIGPWHGERPVAAPAAQASSAISAFDDVVLSPVPLARQWSFTALAGLADPEGALSDPTAGDKGASDEMDSPLESAENQGELGLGDLLPAGPAFGNVVHAIFERVDLTARDLDEALRAGYEEIARVDATARAIDPDVLVPWLKAAATAPLGDALHQHSLSTMSPRDQLRELRFEMSLGRGGPTAALRRLAAAIAAHTSGPLQTWARALEAGRGATPLRGHLTGSIDLVVRMPSDAGGRYWICDYKTNRLRGAGAYEPRALIDAMIHHDYPLQAVIYGVALHRYLRWRLADYDPDAHFGGALYLFVRAMADRAQNESSPVGVFTWDMPAALVIGASDALSAED